MRNIEVAVLHEAHNCPAGMMMFLARLTQRGHNIGCMNDLLDLYEKSTQGDISACTVSRIATLPHGTIKRFTPITVAIVGASRRFLAQARTHQVGVNYVSASLQYSNYSGKADFVVPYSILFNEEARNLYLDSCEASMKAYDMLTLEADNDTAGYAAPQGLRNILIMQANHESWMSFIRARACNRNTNETQYVALRIWEELLKTEDGEELFALAGPDCVHGKCREGKMSCGRLLQESNPSRILDDRWPLIRQVSKEAI